MQSSVAVTAPPVILQTGTAGSSLIYVNSTSAKVNVGALNWLGGWDKRVKITINSSDIDETLVDFPVLVYLSNSSSGENDEDVSCVFSEIGSSFKRMAVTLSDGATQCYVEVEKWDGSNQKAWLWIKVPSIISTKDTVLYLYYDGDHADNDDYVGDTGSSAAQNVWDSSFKGVWHLSQTSGGIGAIKDSTSNNNTGTDYGNPAFNANGLINSAISFDGTDDFINMSNSASLQFTDSLTIEAWANLNSFGSGSDVDTLLRKGEANPNDYQLAVHDQRLELIIVENDDGGLHGSTTLSATTWLHLVGTWNGTTRKVYLNGTEDGSGSKTGTITPDTRAIYIGGRAGTDLSTGIIDEVRASSKARSAAWIKASYESEIDDLVDFGPEETNIEDYVDDNSSNVDSHTGHGTSSNFTAQQDSNISYNDTLTEANAGGTVNTEDFVDGNLSNVDSSAGYGTSSNFAAQQDSNIAYNDTLTEGYTVGSPLTITFRAVGAETTGTGAVTPPLPAGMSSGDICILVATTIGGGSVTITADGSVTPWTAITGSPVDMTGGEKVYVWWGRYSSGSTGPTVTPGSDHVESGIAAWYNCLGAGSPIDVTETGSEATSDTSFSFATTISTTLNSEMCICVCTTGQDTATNNRFTTMADTSLTSLAERMDYCTSSGGGGGFALDEGYKSTAGAVGTWTSTLTSAYNKSYISFALKPEYAANYKMDYEFNYTVSDWGQTNEYLCIRTHTYSGTAENLGVDWWNSTSSAWVTVTASLTASSWNNVSISSYLTAADIYFRFIGKTETSDTSQNTWIIECNLIHYWTDPNYELDYEIQWTTASYGEGNEYLCMRTNTYSGTAENIGLDVWSGGSWTSISSALTASAWNNISINTYLTSATITFRFIGKTESIDTSQNTWEIECSLLHVWSSIEATHDYVLGVNNTITSPWQVRLKEYSSSSIARLKNCTISFHNSTDGTSNQIVIENGSFTTQTGSWYNLGSLETIYIAMTVRASSMETSYIYAYLEVLIPGTTTYAQYITTFEVN